MPERSRRWGAPGLAALAGLLAATGQAPLGFWPGTLAGLALAAWLLLAATRLRSAAFLGWLFGTFYFGLTLVWIVQPFLIDAATYGWMAPFALLLMAGGLALIWSAGFALAGWLAPSGRFGWAAFALSMGLAEYIRARLFTGFPWGSPGQAFIDTPLAQLASLVGAFGLTVGAFALAGALATAAHRRRPLPALAALVLLAAGWGAGTWQARQPLPERAEPITLRLVQPNAPQALKWDPAWVQTWFDRLRRYSAEPPEQDTPPPDLVIWPETAVATLLGRTPEVERAAVASAAPAPLITGMERLDDAGHGYNSLVAFAPDGSVTALYDKHHLVPFGEYTPLPELLEATGLASLGVHAPGGGFTPGPGPALIDLGPKLGRALPLICYEAIFPRDLLAAPGRPDWILQITNDAWFGTFSGPQQHLVQARFRAIEMGLPFARAANTGVSAVIDARGQVTASLPLGTEGWLDAALPAALPATVYARFGDTPLALVLLAGLLGLVAARRAKAVDPGESPL